MRYKYLNHILPSLEITVFVITILAITLTVDYVISSNMVPKTVLWLLTIT